MADQKPPQVPPIPTYPLETIQNELPPEEWQVCLRLWIVSLKLRLAVTDEQFSKLSLGNVEGPFLLSYLSRHPSPSKYTKGSNDAILQKLSYLLLKRALSTPHDSLSPIALFELLSGGCTTFGNQPSWTLFLKSIWSSNQQRIKKAVDAGKLALSAASASKTQIAWLEKLSALTKSLPQTATVTVASADYLDTLTERYKSGGENDRSSITKNLFYSFVALLDNKHISILTDNLYHLKSEADQTRRSEPSQTTLLSSLLCTTSFLKHFSSNSEIATKKQSLAGQLLDYRQHMAHLHSVPSASKHRKKLKGKMRASADGDIQIHQAAQISQVHELFPHLSTTYIMKALDYFSGDAETVTAALLEPESLPPELSDQSIPDDQLQFDPGVPDLAPRGTPPLLPERKNIFDNDDFDRLQISAHQIRWGKKDLGDEAFSLDEHARSKAAILSALATFDSDDDERDDTYDVADVGGAVDNTVDTDERRERVSDTNEGALYKLWKENPSFFSRDSKTRASNLRQQVKKEVSMTDEQIEGWAIILNRDKKMQDRLQDKYSDARAFSGGQKVLRSTRWQANTSADNSEAESGPERSGDGRRMGQKSIHGHGQFHRGRGNSSGPTNEASTQAARKRKEQGRGGGGASRRRDGRMKKMGRGMGALPST